MSHFEYLSVLLSVVIGLAIARILGTGGELIRSRSRVRLYGPQLLWMTLALVLLVYGWWATWKARDLVEGFGFLGYLGRLVQPGLLVLVAYLLAPAIPERGLDLRAYYFAHHRWIFGLLAVANLLVLGAAVQLDLGAASIATRCLMAALLVLLAVSRSEHTHQVGSLVTAATVAAIIALDEGIL